MVDGHVHVKEQITEYVKRGDLLENWSYLDFFLGTYDGKCLKEKTTKRGRPGNTRVPYQDSYNHPGRCRVIRSPGHETMPYFPGQWFPARDDPERKDLFEACMLAILTPWRQLSDLKHPSETFQQAFARFWDNAPESVRKTVRNIEFYHECSKSAQNRRESFQADFQKGCDGSAFDQAQADEPESGHESVEGECLDISVSNEEVLSALQKPFGGRELLFADTAVAIGIDSGVFTKSAVCKTYQRKPAPASAREIALIRVWEHEINNMSPKSPEEVAHSPIDDSQISRPSIIQSAKPTSHDPDVNNVFALYDGPNWSDEEISLNERQLMAHNIITNHLRQHLNNEKPPQILMMIHGEGGTGKSRLLKAISDTFSNNGASHLLAKIAMSGVAASIVNGSTLHSWAALPVRKPGTDTWVNRPSREIENRRKRNIGQAQWLTIDEMSMLTTPLLAHLSNVTSVVRASLNSVEASIPFGGLNVVLLGDFHQLPPVVSHGKELFHSKPYGELPCKGKSLYDQFDVVIRLEEQMRIHDPTWVGILQRTRTGDCTSEDITEIRKLVLTNPDCDIPDFQKAPWNDTILVTSRNSVRAGWNTSALESHCRSTGHIRYVLITDDRVNGEPITPSQRLAVAQFKADDTNKLPNVVELALEMRAMVLLNMATDADLANGSRGIIKDIILDPRETGVPDETNTVHLSYPPSAILFAPLNGEWATFPGLPKGTVPIFPSKTSFRLHGKMVHRQQYALTPAYAFTDFKSQGQTIESVIVDLARPPSSFLSAFNAYVALSRSRGQDTIRLLRDFDEKLFTVHPNEELRAEDERLDVLAEQTIERYRRVRVHQ